MGLIIGEQTGGTNIFHANSIRSQLKHSGLEYGIATTKIYSACVGEQDEGVIPDVLIKPTVLDLVNKEDPVIKYTLHLINKIKAAEAKEKK